MDKAMKDRGSKGDRATLSGLPLNINTDFRQKVLPRLRSYLGSLTSPWLMPSHETLNTFYKEVFGENLDFSTGVGKEAYTLVCHTKIFGPLLILRNYAGWSEYQSFSWRNCRSGLYNRPAILLGQRCHG